MPTDGGLHDDRARAESFGSVAEAYDRNRPSFPVALIDELVSRVPAGGHVLDIGCGTGKAARLLAERGLAVLGVEIDERMAAVARGHGIEVEVAPFECWDDRGRRFHLLTCAQAWHWIDPRAGARRAADVLEPGGTLALFWNHGRPQPDLQEALDRVYSAITPGLAESVANRPPQPSPGNDLRAEGRFEDFQERRYPWRQEYSTDAWMQLLGTHSDHLRLDPRLRARLFDAIAAEVDAHGGRVTQEGTTYALLARRVAPRVAG